MNAGGRRDVYLPAGVWVNLFDGKRTTGPCWLYDFDCPLRDMPVWARTGASLPVYPLPVSCTDEMNLNRTVRLIIDETYQGLDQSVLANLLLS
jgi:alpha-glucosidase (family GH31 glycosyl hydrolase)